MRAQSLIAFVSTELTYSQQVMRHYWLCTVNMQRLYANSLAPSDSNMSSNIFLLLCTSGQCQQSQLL